jgi:hypothetical protein
MGHDIGELAPEIRQPAALDHITTLPLKIFFRIAEHCTQEDGGTYEVNDVVGDHVDPAEQALVLDVGQEGRLPLQQDVDNEASEDPVEAAAQHLRRVQHAAAQVERPVGVKGRLRQSAHQHFWS